MIHYLDKMNHSYVIDRLEQNHEVLLNLLEADSFDEVLFRPESKKWCLLEIVCHLVDEEVFDFRTRVKTALNPDKYDLQPIDPVGWVTSKKYMKADYESKVAEWSNERRESIRWLRSLNAPDWNSSLAHPDFGDMSAQLFLANWLAHDQLHIRQINGLKRDYLAHVSDEDLRYAGKW